MIKGNTRTVFRYLNDRKDANGISRVMRSELASYLNCALITITRILDELEFKGYLRRLEYTKGKSCIFEILKEDV